MKTASCTPLFHDVLYENLVDVVSPLLFGIVATGIERTIYLVAISLDRTQVQEKLGGFMQKHGDCMCELEAGYLGRSLKAEALFEGK